MSAASSARMVGRAEELGVLLDAVAAARDGSPRTVIVRGEAGIGKTRLLEELHVVGRELDPQLVIATGQCVDVGTIGTPFTPVRRLLWELRDGVGEEALRKAARTPSVVATLATLLPELSTEVEAPTGRADFVAEAVERVIEGLSTDHHLLLVIEDLHWADSATLDLLRTLAVTLRGSHVAVVMTYRSDDVGRGHPLRPVLAELDRSRLVTGIELSRLTAAEIAEQTAQIAGSLRGADLDRVVSRSEGVPFFVEELVALGDGELPDTLRGLVLARYDRLSEDARALVGVASAGGVRVSHAALEEVYAGGVTALRAGLREALAANILVADDDGYRFRHALIQEAVHDELLPSERAGLHRSFGGLADDRVAAGDRAIAALAAEHWFQARDLPRAFDALVLARRHAVDTFAYSAAAAFGEQLLELWPQVPDAAARAGCDLSSLYLDLARDARLDPARAGRIARAGLRGEASATQRAALLRELAASLANEGRMSACSDTLDEAMALLGDDPEQQPVRARVLGLRSTLPLSLVGSTAERLRMAEAAVALAESSGEVETLLYTLRNLAYTQSDVGALGRTLETIARIRAFDLAPPDALECDVNVLDTLVRLGRFAEAIATGEDAARYAVEVGLERGVGGMLAANLGEAMLASGRYEEAVATLAHAQAMVVSMPTFQSFILRLRVSALSWNGRHDDADQLREPLAELVAQTRLEDTEERIGWAESEAEDALNRLSDDGPERARLLETALRETLTLAEPDLMGTQCISRRILPAAARCGAEVRLTGRSGPDVDALLTAVRAAADAQYDDGPGRAYRLLVAAELARGEGAAAVEEWRAAVESPDLDTLPVRYRHYSRYRLAHAYLATDQREAAAPLLDEVERDAAAVGATIITRWARADSERAGLATRTSDRDAVGVRLTQREQQVLELVAEGLTNRQIGERLYISHKTASVHVSAILAKVGARSRAEAAAIHASRVDV